MIANQDTKTSGNLKGLGRAVDEATHPLMKRLGMLALEQRFSQEGLAKSFNKRFGTSLNGANVKAHITARRPQSETIKRYAKLLGLDDEKLHILEHGALPANREEHWVGVVLSAIASLTADFKPGAAKAVRDALSDPKLRSRVLAAVAMAGHFPDRSTRWLPRAVEPTIDVLAEALYPHLNMRDFLRDRSPNDEALFPIFHSARSLYRNDSKALAFVDACAAILRLDGIDTTQMDEHLRDLLRGRGIGIGKTAKSGLEKGSRP